MGAAVWEGQGCNVGWSGSPEDQGQQSARAQTVSWARAAGLDLPAVLSPAAQTHGCRNTRTHGLCH